MSKVGLISVVAGFVLLIGYGLYNLMLSEAPGLIKIAVFLIALGITFVLFKQIDDRSDEKKEEDEYKKY